MKASELKWRVEQSGNEPYFFTRKTMQFFGDRMSNYGVRSAVIDTYSETGVECWELYRRQPVKNGLQSSAYFRKDAFERAFQKRD